MKQQFCVTNEICDVKCLFVDSVNVLLVPSQWLHIADRVWRVCDIQ